MTAPLLPLPALCVLTAPGRTAQQAADDARALFGAGVPWVQLRIKSGSDADVVRAVERLVPQVPPGFRLTLNDRVDLALAAGIRSVHLGDRDLPVEAARRLMGGDAEIGLSTHSATEAAAATARPVDLVALGPIFESGTKRGGRRTLGVNEVAAAARLCAKPLVVIGGIREAQLAELFAAGASAIAVIGEIWSAPDPVASAVRLSRQADQLRAETRGETPR